MWAYCDTSALVKRYVREPGRRRLMGLLRERSCVSSALAPVELRSAFRRRADEATLDRARLPLLFDRVAADRRRWTLVAVSGEVLDAAERIVGLHPLRTLDAIHVASAGLFAAHLPSSLAFVTADRRQAQAATAAGLDVQLIE